MRKNRKIIGKKIYITSKQKRTKVLYFWFVSKLIIYLYALFFFITPGNQYAMPPLAESKTKSIRKSGKSQFVYLVNVSVLRDDRHHVVMLLAGIVRILQYKIESS